MNYRWLAILLALTLTGCASLPTAAPILTPLATINAPVSTAPNPTMAASATLVPSPSPTGSEASAALGTDTDPLTGLKVSNPNLLNRRPMAIKVENIPRADRPQFGLSFADVVYEYYTEEGASRFIAVYYGQDAQQVGPIRSARFFDVNVVRMYKAIFAFGSAWIRVLDRLRQSSFSDLLVVETGNDCPPMCRFEPNGRNFLITDTAKLSAYITQKGIDNSRQDLSGMNFQSSAPAGGQPLSRLYVRYSAADYARWDYDPATGLYTRSVDQQDDPTGTKEIYGVLTDRSTKQPITAANVVVLLIPTDYVIRPPKGEVVDMEFNSIGAAYGLRDGQVYKLQWERLNPDSIVQISFPDGTPYPYKPGNTWYEVIGASSTLTQQNDGWRFIFKIP
jgi:hypothetical protein